MQARNLRAAKPQAGRAQTPKKSPYEIIRDAIVEGTLAPGTQLVEVSVAEMCGVSRTPAREALTRLEQDGLLERGPRGLYVRERSPEQILDIYQVRIVLEAEAARLAAERHTELDMVRIESFQRACERADAKRPADLARANAAFHEAIWEAGRNAALIDLMRRLSLHIARYPETTLAYPGRWDEALAEHRQLVDAIGARDGAAATSVATKHFHRAREIRLESWAKDML